MKEKSITILGSTGSIGTQALEVARVHKLSIRGLAAHSNVKLLEEQIREFSPYWVCVYEEKAYQDLKGRIADLSCKVLCGMEGLCQLAGEGSTDLVLNSVVGMVGLLPTLTALEAGNPVALANKETLVAGGNLVMELAKKKQVPILPVDSEHSAIFQCLQGNRASQLRKIFLTASGGPFFGKSREELERVTAKEALRHPNWSMGAKVTVDSATLMNKGLECMEAKWLFDLQPEQLEIVVHRQSIVHSAVEYQDGSVIAQMSVPDMRLPIQYALLYPERMPGLCRPLSLTEYGTLSFEKPDPDTFLCLKTALEALKQGPSACCLVNGVNEEAVPAFLKGKISFLAIGELAAEALATLAPGDIGCYEDVWSIHQAAREFVLRRI